MVCTVSTQYQCILRDRRIRLHYKSLINTVIDYYCILYCISTIRRSRTPSGTAALPACCRTWSASWPVGQSSSTSTTCRRSFARCSLLSPHLTSSSSHFLPQQLLLGLLVLSIFFFSVLDNFTVDCFLKLYRFFQPTECRTIINVLV